MFRLGSNKQTASIVNGMAVEMGLNSVKGICTLLTSFAPWGVNKISRIMSGGVSSEGRQPKNWNESI